MEEQSAEQHLDQLRRNVRATCPTVRTFQSVSARDRGEDRYELGPGDSIYVQAPATAAGEPRRYGSVWRYGPATPTAPWEYAGNRRELVLAICLEAAAAGHQVRRRWR